MSVVPGSSIDHAIDYARAGYSVGWFDDGEGVRDALYMGIESLAEDPDVTIHRANGRERIDFPGGGRVVFFRSDVAGRGHSLDVVYLASKYRCGELLEAIVPALATSDLGYMYTLCERVA